MRTLLMLTVALAASAAQAQPTGQIASLMVTSAEKQIVREAEAMLTAKAGQSFMIDYVAIIRETDGTLVGCGIGFTGPRENGFRFRIRGPAPASGTVNLTPSQMAGCGSGKLTMAFARLSG